MVGDLISEGISDKDAVSGDTPNLAAQLQALAAPGRVVISQATRRLVGGLFELTDLGPKRLKGFAERLAVWRIDGEGCAEGRFEARYSHLGRPSIPPGRLLRALLLQAFYSVRSERLLMEQLDYNLLYRWFPRVGPEGRPRTG